MFEQVRTFLGPARVRALILLLGITGLINLVLNAVGSAESAWVIPAQSLTVIIFLAGTALIIGSRLSPQARLRWISILAPAVGALLLALTVLPHLLLPLAGAATGWVIAGIFIFRPRVPREFQQAVRHMRKGEYEEAVESLNGLIKTDSENENYYRFRAEIFRLWGKLDRARKDYEHMIRIAPDSAVAYNGLAEVLLQAGRYSEAREAGLKALELAPDEWVAAYNLGMIEDRLNVPDAAVGHLQAALQQRVPDARHRLLIHLYLARAYQRMGDQEGVQKQVQLLRQERSGLEEWQSLLKYEQAAALRAVLEADIQLAQDLADGRVNSVL